VKNKIKEVSVGLPSKKLADGTVSKVTIVPFYDRTDLIKETIGTLESALSHETLISVLVIIILLLNLRASFVVSFLLSIAVLMAFIAMKLFHIDANIVALSGIAIAIGVMVDMGIVDVENVTRHMEMPGNNNLKGKKLIKLIYDANIEVIAAVTVALATTIVSFLPVFTMEAAEGKLFQPLAFTKTFALLSSYILGIVVLPTLVYFLYSIPFDKKTISRYWNICLIVIATCLIIFWQNWIAISLILISINNLLEYKWTESWKKYVNLINILIVSLVVVYFLSYEWLPMGAHNSLLINFLFVIGIVIIILTPLILITHFYERILNWCLKNRLKFFMLPIFTVVLGIVIWLGFNKSFGFISTGIEKLGWNVKQTSLWQKAQSTFPGLGKEFMPALDEGSYLLMPTSMPHAGIEKNIEYVKTLDKRLNSIPEVDVSVGKWGRVNSALDPAPVQMFENTINYKPEYILSTEGHRMRFKVDENENYLIDINKVKEQITLDYSNNKSNIKAISLENKTSETEIEFDKIKEIKFNKENNEFIVLVNNNWLVVQNYRANNILKFIFKNF